MREKKHGNGNNPSLGVFPTAQIKELLTESRPNREERRDGVDAPSLEVQRRSPLAGSIDFQGQYGWQHSC